MANGYITEYPELAQDTLGRDMLVGKGNGINQTPVSFTTTTQSAAFGADMHIIRLHVDAACHVLFSANPTATTNHAKMVAGQTEFFNITPGEKLALVTA